MKRRDDIAKGVIDALASRAMIMPIGMYDDVLEDLDDSWPPYYRFLYLCVKEFEPKLVLELGTAGGVCAAHMASAGRSQTTVITVDKDPQPLAYDLAVEYQNMQVWDGDSCSFHDRLVHYCEATGFNIGLLFLDTEHDGITPKREFETYKDLLMPGCIVAVDDLLGPEHLHEAMMEFWNWLPGLKIELNDLHPRRIGPTIAYHDQPGFGVCIL